MGKDEGFNSTYKSMFFLLITLTVIYILIVSFYGARLEQNQHCKGNKYTDYGNNDLTTSYIIEDAGQRILQKFSVPEVNSNIYYEFCYDLESNETSSSFQISIVDENNTVLGRDFFKNGTNHLCTPLDASLIRQEMYLGVRCDNCDTNDNICLMEEVLGKTVKQVRVNGTVELYEDHTLSYVLNAREDCKTTITFFTRWYITILAFLGLGILMIFGGYQKIKEEVIDNSGL